MTKYIALYYDNVRKEVTFGLYGIFDTIENADKCLKSHVFKHNETDILVDIGSDGLPIDKKIHNYVKPYVCMSNTPYCGKFVKGYITFDNNYLFYCSTTYVIVEVNYFNS